MDWIAGIQKALDYIEQNLAGELDYEEIAKAAFSSSYHFQRIFSLLCGCTLGEYIRRRRLALAGAELASGRIRVIDAAVKYGYDSPDSFSKAFLKFHGITPSAAREPGAQLRSFARLSIRLSLEGGGLMNYRIEEKTGMILTGYKRRFRGVPYGAERQKQEEAFFTSTRAKQWLLRGPSIDGVDYCVVTNFGDDGYDFYIASLLTAKTREELYDPSVTGVDFMERMDFESLKISACTYAVFETERTQYPTIPYQDIRTQIVSQWLPSSGFQLADAPEIVRIHWKQIPSRQERFIEIWIPVEGGFPH